MPRTPRSEQHCQYVSPLGRKCRQLRAEGHPSLCRRHSLRPQHVLSEASAAQLLGQIGDFASAAPVNQFLANLLKMTARGLIARRDAAVLAYIAQSLLNSLAARRRELLDEQRLAENEPVTVVWDVPRPDRSEEQSRHTEASGDRARYQRLCPAGSASDSGHAAEEPALVGSRPVPGFSAIRHT